ncbi:hypothetical protein ACIG0C_30260 [Kitasatospora aureofaciens]|uniref:Uncharacterized protein n=1 Tax=Kitasatospora aureofaciens TaxID=1894 RepID=A0A1E7NE81_KITAU|nr:hypothetical protein [Kitasatospora aureofaciens]ARF83239.1 hypothetical protein B6264_30330 [Kitasatospora aureofaciens]OEV39009.1 hypothetical protein HS99_0018060 [Kitasatospora aureofaciens]GGU99494.1 hypothetical protein GCM10010502_62460 [Kitasatospora aureofaciens]
MNQPSRPNPFAPFGQEQPDPKAGDAPGTLRAAAAQRARKLTAPGSVLDRRRREVLAALNGDWDDAQPWIKAVVYLLALTAGVLLLAAAGGILLTALTDLVNAVHLPTTLPAHSTGLVRTVTDPVHRYLAARTAGVLPVTGTAAYTLWKATGLAAALIAFVTRGATARLAWTAWSCAALAMVWAGTDPAGRPVAVGITAAAIAFVSLFALRGLSFSLRPVIYNMPRNEVAAPTINVTIPAQPGPAQDTDPAREQ